MSLRSWATWTPERGTASWRPPALGRVAESDADQEHERSSGRRREAADERDEDATFARRRPMNAGLTRAREAKGEPLTPDEANTIRAKFGAKQDGVRV